MRKINTEAVADKEIVRRVVDGDSEAFAHLMERYGSYVLTIVQRHVPRQRVEDVAQEVFLKAFQSLAKIKNAPRFKNWLATIAVRTCYDFWRQHYRNSEWSASSLDDDHHRWLEGVIADQSDDAWAAYGRQQEAREILDWALNQLNPEDRMVVELVHLEGLTGKEAAGLLGWSVTNVKVRAFRSRNKLQKLLMESEWRQ